MPVPLAVTDGGLVILGTAVFVGAVAVVLGLVELWRNRR